MKIKELIKCVVTAQLIWAFVFAKAKIQFSHDAAHSSHLLHICTYDVTSQNTLFVCGVTSQSIIIQSCRDGATISWGINHYCGELMCLAEGHNKVQLQSVSKLHITMNHDKKHKFSYHFPICSAGLHHRLYIHILS